MKNKFLLTIILIGCFCSYVFSQTKATGREVMIQGFHWTTDVSATKWYEVIKSNSAALQTAGFDAIWLPPPSKSTGGMGYIPTVWYDLNNAQGTQAQLVSLITDLHSKNIKVIADIVINHRGGTLGWYDFSTPSWNTPTETWSICNNSNISATGQKGTGAPDYDPVAAGLKSPGESGSFSAARDLDHSNALVREGIKTWMNWLKTDIGFDGWRYDFVHGYDGKYIKEYNDATSPYFSVGEILEGNRDRIVKWIDYTKAGTTTASSAAFDFATKSTLQNAFNDNNLSYLKDGNGKASGLIGVWPSNAVTMLDNHDTGPAPYGQDLWVFPGGQVLKGYAYLLTHPGTPMVWWPHYFNWGIKTEIDAMIKIRKDNQLSSTSALNIVAATTNLYAAIIDDKVAMKLGSDNWSPSGTGWILKLSGTGFAIWDKLSAVDVPSLTIVDAGGTYNTGTTVNAVLTANLNTSTIYYTTDGSEPTTASASAVGSKSLVITSNTIVKAFVKNTLNVSSAVKTETYTFSTAPPFTVYFKKPSTWSSSVKIYYWATTGTTTAVTWPGVAMTPDCGDWYTFTFPSTVSASSVIFNDGTSQTTNLTATAGIKYYDGGWLSAEPVGRCPIAPDLTIAPAGGSFTTGNTVNVVLTANVNTSTIYYTTNGTEPTTASSSAVGTKSLAITANTTLKAFVKNTSNASSAVKTEVYSFNLAPDLTIAPAGGSFTTGNTVNVVLAANVNTSTIYYTTDGTEPTTASSSAVGAKSLAITANTTLKAFVKNTSNVSSAVKTEVYSFSLAPDLTIAPAGGSFTTGNTVNVVLTANVNTSTIYYTTDGMEPTTASSSAVGTKSLAITANTTLKAFVKNTSNASSAVKTEVYNFSLTPDLIIAPAGGSFTTGNTVNVVLTGNVNTSTIYYTTDGTEPTIASSSAVGTKSLAITANTTLKAFVKNTSNVSSAVKTEVYSFSLAPDLTIAPAGGLFTTGNTVNVVLTANVNTSTIYYTTDGTEPTTASSSAVGTKSLAITANTTLKAFVKNTSNASSAVKTEVYSFSLAPDLTIAPAGGSFTTGNTVNVVLTANVNTSTIYYTTDGTEPTTASSSAVGTKSLAITANTTLKAFVKNTSNASSAVKTEVYSFVTPNTLTVYFKPPTTWTSVPKIHYWNAIPAGSIANSIFPGATMTTYENGFYKYTIVGATSVSVVFSNGMTGANNQTAELLNVTDGFSYTWTDTLGVTDLISKENAVKIYPNPVSDLLKIETHLATMNYQIIGIQGNLIQRGIPLNNTIDVSNLKEGVYIIKIKFENEEQYFQKFIKK
jgi:hypothetical protein